MVINYEDIARTVLKLAASFDQRLYPVSQEFQDERRKAWATLFVGRVWPEEAEQAVVSHYRNPRAFPILPGDIVAYCDSQPVWSSRDHARDWVMRMGVQNPYSGVIEQYSGIREPIIEIPPEIRREGEKAHLIAKLTEWATPRLDELAEAIVAKKFVPWWNGGTE